MSKIKVYELAKELGKSSKELMEFLADRKIEVKSHMSALEDEDAQRVRRAFTEKAGGGAGEKGVCRCRGSAPQGRGPEEKEYRAVFRPQNSRDGRI